MEPLFLKGAVKDYIWGGQKLKTLFGKKSSGDYIAESWELSCHSDGCSAVINSKEGNTPLTQYVKAHGRKQVLGKSCGHINDVPIIKLIDAKEPLSVQVHPDDDYARSKGFANGKTEMWYVIDAEEGAEIVYGIAYPITKDEFREHIEKGTLDRVLKYVPVKKGDVFYIPAGTIHAIGKGILIAEVQQNCNLTYRVFDYGRKDADGKERELHIEDAIEAANLTPGVWENPYPTWRFPWGEKQTLSYCQYFVTNCITVYSERKFEVKPSSFTHILVTDGIGLLFTESGDYSIKKGDSVLLPAGIGTCRINGSLRYIETYLPSDDE